MDNFEKSLEEKLFHLRTAHKALMSDCVKIESRLKKLEARNKKLREALEDIKAGKYIGTMMCSCNEAAHKALTETEEA